MASLNRSTSKEISILSTDGKIPAGFVIAGFKVIDKAGGPELVVVGFTYESDTVNDNGILGYPDQVFQKAYFNTLKQSDNELFNNGSNKVYNYHFFRDMNDNWNEREMIGNVIFFVCKYWNNETNQFFYLSKSIIEITAV